MPKQTLITATQSSVSGSTTLTVREPAPTVGTEPIDLAYMTIDCYAAAPDLTQVLPDYAQGLPSLVEYYVEADWDGWSSAGGVWTAFKTGGPTGVEPPVYDSYWNSDTPLPPLPLFQPEWSGAFYYADIAEDVSDFYLQAPGGQFQVHGPFPIVTDITIAPDAQTVTVTGRNLDRVIQFGEANFLGTLTYYSLTLGASYTTVSFSSLVVNSATQVTGVLTAPISSTVKIKEIGVRTRFRPVDPVIYPGSNHLYAYRPNQVTQDPMLTADLGINTYLDNTGFQTPAAYTEYYFAPRNGLAAGGRFTKVLVNDVQRTNIGNYWDFTPQMQRNAPPRMIAGLPEGCATGIVPSYADSSNLYQYEDVSTAITKFRWEMLGGYAEYTNLPVLTSASFDGTVVTLHGRNLDKVIGNVDWAPELAYYYAGGGGSTLNVDPDTVTLISPTEVSMALYSPAVFNVPVEYLRAKIYFDPQYWNMQYPTNWGYCDAQITWRPDPAAPQTINHGTWFVMNSLPTTATAYAYYGLDALGGWYRGEPFTELRVNDTIAPLISGENGDYNPGYPNWKTDAFRKLGRFQCIVNYATYPATFDCTYADGRIFHVDNMRPTHIYLPPGTRTVKVWGTNLLKQNMSGPGGVLLNTTPSGSLYLMPFASVSIVEWTNTYLEFTYGATGLDTWDRPVAVGVNPNVTTLQINFETRGTESRPYHRIDFGGYQGQP